MAGGSQDDVALSYGFADQFANGVAAVVWVLAQVIVNHPAAFGSRFAH